MGRVAQAQKPCLWGPHYFLAPEQQETALSSIRGVGRVAWRAGAQVCQCGHVPGVPGEPSVSEIGEMTLHLGMAKTSRALMVTLCSCIKTASIFGGKIAKEGQGVTDATLDLQRNTKKKVPIGNMDLWALSLP